MYTKKFYNVNFFFNPNVVICVSMEMTLSRRVGLLQNKNKLGQIGNLHRFFSYFFSVQGKKFQKEFIKRPFYVFQIFLFVI